MAKPKRNILHVPPSEDQGSESRVGYDYQDHCAARLCLKMAIDREGSAIVCEYHEDITQLTTKSPCFYSVKKRDSGRHWTLGALKLPLLKLLKKRQYKNVGSLHIVTHGRPDKDSQFSLYNLITLLDCSNEDRDKQWESSIDEFATHLSKLFDSLSFDLIQDGLRHLSIELNWPHPDAIALENIDLATQVIAAVWGVTCTSTIAKRAYDKLLVRIKAASNTPQLPLSSKKITKTEAMTLLKSVLCEEKLVADDSQTIVDTYTKLQRVGLESCLQYALQMRMSARETKFASDLTAKQWHALKTDIAAKLEEQRRVRSLRGPALMNEVRAVLGDVAQEWERSATKSSLGGDFAESLFFEMLAVCEAGFNVQ
jgi:hypothetical protein